jgi:hypothetical protein
MLTNRSEIFENVFPAVAVGMPIAWHPPAQNRTCVSQAEIPAGRIPSLATLLPQAVTVGLRPSPSGAAVRDVNACSEDRRSHQKGGKMNASERWFRLLLRLYPADFREEMGEALGHLRLLREFG